MLVYDTNLTFAVRCAECGRFEFHNISMFQLLKSGKTDFKCHCEISEMTLAIKDNEQIIINIPCLACEIVHTYKYRLKEVLQKRLTVVCCSETRLELCFFGKDKDVRDTVSKYQEDINLLLGELGLIGGN